jgi:hypothetical protein
MPMPKRFGLTPKISSTQRLVPERRILTVSGLTGDAARHVAAPGKVAEIPKDVAPVRLLVDRTDEEREIAQQTVSAIGKANLLNGG